MIERGLDVLEVGVAVFALDGVDGDALVDQRRGDVVLRAQRIGGAEDQLGAAGVQGLHQMRGLGGDVQAGGDALPFERLLLAEPLADVGQDRHRTAGPFDAAVPLRGEVRVLDVVRGLHLFAGHGHHPSLPEVAERARPFNATAAEAPAPLLRSAAPSFASQQEGDLPEAVDLSSGNVLFYIRGGPA